MRWWLVVVEVWLWVWWEKGTTIFFKATRGPHGTSSAGASFLHLFSARLLPLSFFFSLLLFSRVRKVKITGEAVRLLLLPSISISRSSKRTSHNQRSWSWLKSREYLGLGSSSARSPLLYNFFESDCRNPPLPLPVPCINQKNIKTLPPGHLHPAWQLSARLLENHAQTGYASAIAEQSCQRFTINKHTCLPARPPAPTHPRTHARPHERNLANTPARTHPPWTLSPYGRVSRPP